MIEGEGGATSVLVCSEKSSSRLLVLLKHVLLGTCRLTERTNWQL